MQNLSLWECSPNYYKKTKTWKEKKRKTKTVSKCRQHLLQQSLSRTQSIKPIHPNRPALLRCYINRATLPFTPPQLPWAPQQQEIDVSKEFCPIFPSAISRPTLKNTGCTSKRSPSEALTGLLGCAAATSLCLIILLQGEPGITESWWHTFTKHGPERSARAMSMFV